jgi:hypothetical protein
VLNDPVNNSDPTGQFLMGCDFWTGCPPSPIAYTQITWFSQVWKGEQWVTVVNTGFWQGYVGVNPNSVPTVAQAMALAQKSLNNLLHNEANNALNNLSSQCKGALKNDGINLGSTEATTSSTQYFDTALPVDGALTVRDVTGAPDDETLVQYLGNSVAGTLPTASGSAANDVVVGALFFSQNAAGQAITLVHEALHTGTGLGDVALAGELGLGKFTNTPAGIQAASDSITDWLAFGCMPTGN